MRIPKKSQIGNFHFSVKIKIINFLRSVSNHIFSSNTFDFQGNYQVIDFAQPPIVPNIQFYTVLKLHMFVSRKTTVVHIENNGLFVIHNRDHRDVYLGIFSLRKFSKFHLISCRKSSSSAMSLRRIPSWP